MRLVLSAFLVGFVAVGLIAVGSLQVANPTTAGVLTGVVVDDAGTAVTGATVDLRVGARVERTTVTDASGAFRFDIVVATVYQIRAFMPGFQPDPMSVEVVKDRPTRRYASALVDRLRTEADRFQESGPDAAAGVVRRHGRGLTGRTATSSCSGPHTRQPRDRWHAVTRRSPHLPSSTPRPTTRSTRTRSTASATTRSRRSRSTSTRRRTRTSAASSTTAQLPPADAVRIEELVNYFPYDYPRPAGRRRRSRVTTEVGRVPVERRAPAGAHRPEGADRSTPSARRRATSSSCSTCPARWTTPDKLPLVKTAHAPAGRRHSRADDRVAIVVYAGARGPGAAVDARRTQGRRSSTAIADLQAGGSTNGAAGIQLAYDIGRQQLHQGRHQPRDPRAPTATSTSASPSQGELDPADRGEGARAACS